MYDIQRIMDNKVPDMEDIVKNNRIDELRACLENSHILHDLKTNRVVFSTVDHDSIQEHSMAALDYAALEAAESDKLEIVELLYPHLSSERHLVDPDTGALSVKDLILKHLIQKNTGRSMIQTILDDTSYDPSYPHDNMPLQEAIADSNVELVRLILHHPRVTICEDTLDDGLMSHACRRADSEAGIEILKMFLDDPRFNLSRDANQAIHTLAYYSLNVGLACIVNHPRIRWDWFGIPSPLAKCVENTNMEGVRILLSQPLYDPCLNNNDAYHVAKSIQSTHPEFMAELLSNERIAKSVQKSKLE